MYVLHELKKKKNSRNLRALVGIKTQSPAFFPTKINKHEYPFSIRSQDRINLEKKIQPGSRVSNLRKFRET